MSAAAYRAVWVEAAKTMNIYGKFNSDAEGAGRFKRSWKMGVDANSDLGKEVISSGIVIYTQTPPNPVIGSGVVVDAQGIVTGFVQDATGQGLPEGHKLLVGEWDESVVGEPLKWPRAERDRRLAADVDPIVTNPMRWNALSETKRAALTDYRLALLDGPETHPDPAKWVWPTLKE